MSVKVGLEETYRNSFNGVFQSYSRPIKALRMYSQRRNSILENESFNQKLPSSWSNDAPQNIELKLTCKETYLKDPTITAALSSAMQCETEDSKEDTVIETKYYPPKKRFLEKAELEADQIDAVDSSLPTNVQSPIDHLGVSIKCLKQTILQCRNAFEAESNRPNTNESEFLLRTFGDISKNNNVDAEENLNLSVQNAQDQKTEPYYRSGYKKFTLQRTKEDSNDSNAIETTTTAIGQLLDKTSEQNKVKEPRGKRYRACKGVRYQQFMNDTLTKRQNKKMGPKKLLINTDTVAKRSKGKKCNLLEENHQVTEVNTSPKSRRETRNSAKAAALQKQKGDSFQGIVENTKKRLISDVSKDLDAPTNIVLLKKRFKTSENNNKCEIVEELKRLSTPPTLSETSSTRFSSPESTCSNGSTHVHYKKRVSRTFTDSQSSLINQTSESDVNLQTLADVALRDLSF